jgi:hypothetical protein
MQKIHRPLSPMLPIMLVAATFATGCAGTPAHDPAKAQAHSLQDIGRQWKQGSELVATGEKTRTKGQELVAEGQKQIAAGDSQISRGKVLMAESETAFRQASSNQPSK